MFRLAGLFPVGDRWATADTNTARLAAALYDAEGPLPIEELAARSGVTQKRGAESIMFGALASVAGRSAVRTWQRKDRIVEQLTSLGVSRTSALVLLRSDQFRRCPDGQVRLAAPDEIFAARADDGTPFWTVPVAGRHLRGYSLQAVPYGLARAAGVTPGEQAQLEVTEPAGCRPVTVSWPLGYGGRGCVVGRVRVPFSRLGLADGDLCDIAVADGTARFSRHRGNGSR